MLSNISITHNPQLQGTGHHTNMVKTDVSRNILLQDQMSKIFRSRKARCWSAQSSDHPHPNSMAPRLIPYQYHGVIQIDIINSPGGHCTTWYPPSAPTRQASVGHLYAPQWDHRGRLCRYKHGMLFHGFAIVVLGDIHPDHIHKGGILITKLIMEILPRMFFRQTSNDSSITGPVWGGFP